MSNPSLLTYEQQLEALLGLIVELREKPLTPAIGQQMLLVVSLTESVKTARRHDLDCPRSHNGR